MCGKPGLNLHCGTNRCFPPRQVTLPLTQQRVGRDGSQRRTLMSRIVSGRFREKPPCTPLLMYGVSWSTADVSTRLDERPLLRRGARKRTSRSPPNMPSKARGYDGSREKRWLTNGRDRGPLTQGNQRGGVDNAIRFITMQLGISASTFDKQIKVAARPRNHLFTSQSPPSRAALSFVTKVIMPGTFATSTASGLLGFVKIDRYALNERRQD